MRVQPLRLVAGILKSGGVIMHATETCYGLAADIFSEKAVEKVYRIKKMTLDKPVSIMVRNLEEAKKYAVFNQKALELAQKHWPGPLTLVLSRKKTLPAHLNKGHSTVGIRCPDSRVSRKLIELNGGPLVTTSANISGKPQAYSVDEMLGQLGQDDARPDYILDSGRIPRNKPSTVVEVRTEGEIRVLRTGCIVL